MSGITRFHVVPGDKALRRPEGSRANLVRGRTDAKSISVPRPVQGVMTTARRQLDGRARHRAEWSRIRSNRRVSGLSNVWQPPHSKK